MKRKTAKRYPQPQPMEVEILPWTHHIGSQLHDAVMEYLEKLPKNSVVALESIPSTTSHLLGYALPKQEILKDPSALASIDLHHTCQNRSLRTVSLESQALNNFRFKAKKSDTNNYTGAIERASEFVDKSYVRTIQAIPSAKKKRLKLTVVVGLGHAVSLSEKLNAAGIRTRVRTDIFNEKLRKWANKCIALNEQLRKAALDKNEELAKERVKRLDDHLATVPRSTETREKLVLERAGEAQMAAFSRILRRTGVRLRI